MSPTLYILHSDATLIDFTSSRQPTTIHYIDNLNPEKGQNPYRAYKGALILSSTIR